MRNSPNQVGDIISTPIRLIHLVKVINATHVSLLVFRSRLFDSVQRIVCVH
jgi:hypothetical protein